MSDPKPPPTNPAATRAKAGPRPLASLKRRQPKQGRVGARMVARRLAPRRVTSSGRRSTEDFPPPSGSSTASSSKSRSSSTSGARRPAVAAAVVPHPTERVVLQVRLLAKAARTGPRRMTLPGERAPVAWPRAVLRTRPRMGRKPGRTGAPPSRVARRRPTTVGSLSMWETEATMTSSRASFAKQPRRKRTRNYEKNSGKSTEPTRVARNPSRIGRRT